MSKFMMAVLAALSFSVVALAQPQKVPAQNRATLEGEVIEASSKAPVSYAVVQLLPQDVYVTTDDSGKFSFKNLEPGKTNIKISFVGLETIDTTITIIPNKVYNLQFKMVESSYRLEEVTILATQNKAGSATASNISRQAMDHLQASSLKDLMQLLPGGAISNPSMSSSNSFTIRTLGSTSDNSNMNSLGTAIIMDGSPLSNNANMQLLSPSVTGGSGALGGGASPASGVDLRGISMDNIESVEVIRGVASAEYGDLSSGAVIIKSKAGKEPLSIKFKTDPRIYQASISKGLDLGGKRGMLNLIGDYAYNTTKQTESYNYYQRVNLKGLYSKNFGDNLMTTSSLEFNLRKDTRERNPNDVRSQVASGARDLGFRFNSNGTYSFSGDHWLKNIKYNVSFSYADKKSYNEELLENAYAAYSMSKQDGAVLSNKPGKKVYDVNGKELTHIYPGEEHFYATYLPNSYFTRYDIYGKEINLFAKVNANFVKRWNKVSNRILIGADFKLDGNNGDGVVYDLENPPLRYSNNASSRPRAFKDIPFIKQFGAYIEDVFKVQLGERELNLTAGARYDNINGKSIIAPRVNLSFDVIPNTLVLRGAYGVNAKAPTQMYLYPPDAYFDYVNFNNLGSSTVAPADQLFLSTTRSFNTENKDLKIAKNTKMEVGLDLMVKKMRLSLTAYKDDLKDGYLLGKDLDCFKLIPYDVYKVATAPDILDLEQRYMIFAMFYKPLNTLNSVNKGLEYELDFGRINSIRTSFYVSGAWMSTETRDMNYSYSTATNLNNLERNIGVYEQGLTTDCVERFNTTFRISHNIPKIGFVFTLTSQVNWKYKYWTEYGNDTMFEKYISRVDGKVYNFDPAKKSDPEFSYLFPALSDTRFIAESYQPTIIFNFMVSKEIGDMLTASFFVNNLFNSRPLYESKAYPGSFTQLGIPTFFGFDLKVSIK